MRRATLNGVLALAMAVVASASLAQERLHHDLRVTIYPKENRFSAEDTIVVPERMRPELVFDIHAGLAPEVVAITPRAAAGSAAVDRKVGVAGTGLVRLKREEDHALTGQEQGDTHAERYRAIIRDEVAAFTLRYGGIIDHPLEQVGREYARGFKATPGTITEQGAYLAGESLWYPTVEGELLSFSLEVELPPGWEAVSQGRRSKHVAGDAKTVVGWQCDHPQEEIFLVASAYTEYSRPAGAAEAMAFLRSPDEHLAADYLDATATYLPMYERLIGRYPYAKFALVENFWETGFGMPSFTLLGPKVIRFPFILHSSYPHEILHNWWGNGVFPDYASGNWAEGLTAYLADHLIKEQRGKGVEHRRDVLQKYVDYVARGRDFPLREFRSRHSSSSEAVGYGKTLMFFHMLRQGLGDDAFRAGIQDFYRANRFATAGFDEMRESFEKVAGKDLAGEFEQWIDRAGAPELRISRVEVTESASGYELSAVIEQTQPASPYRLQVPVAITTDDTSRAVQTVVEMEGREKELRLTLPGRPLRLDVDPEFDVFRKLDRAEIPPALSQALGARTMSVVLPVSAAPPLLEAYRDFARTLAGAGPDEVAIETDDELAGLPPDRAVVVLGWENRFAGVVVAALVGYPVTVREDGVRAEGSEIPRADHAVVLTARSLENSDMAIVFIAGDGPDALPGLGRKLPHYHKYSYLGFEGAEPVNMAKGRWPVMGSPMTVFVAGGGAGRAGTPRIAGPPGVARRARVLRMARETRVLGGAPSAPVSRPEMAGLALREPLVAIPAVFSTQRMMETVRFLASTELAGRGAGSDGLDRAAIYVAEQFRSAGLAAAGDQDGSFSQAWEEDLGEPVGTVRLENVIGVIPGANPDWRGQSVVVGAHYDHLGLGWPDVREDEHGNIHPGADDNASGVAVMLELARALAEGPPPQRSIVFVAFSGEEAGRRGSGHYIRHHARHPASRSIGMVNLDTVGRLGDGKLLVLGGASASEWVHIFRGAGYLTGVDVEMAAEELDSSDQASFQSVGVPAVQLFTGPHLDYHRPTDTADRVDADGLVRVAAVAKEAVEYLAGRAEPLTSPARKGEASLQASQSSDRSDSSDRQGRKVSLGTVPDFAFGGAGYRLSGTVPGSPAEICGLRAGDVIVALGDTPVAGIRDLSAALKSRSPGDRVMVRFTRDGEELKAETALVAR